jgi:hypothetical protein
MSAFDLGLLGSQASTANPDSHIKFPTNEWSTARSLALLGCGRLSASNGNIIAKWKQPLGALPSM